DLAVEHRVAHAAADEIGPVTGVAQPRRELLCRCIRHEEPLETGGKGGHSRHCGAKRPDYSPAATCSAATSIVCCSIIRRRSCGAKKSMIRLIESVALMVCNVENTRWPVSAAVSAVFTVSTSRTSPTRMTSGS